METTTMQPLMLSQAELLTKQGAAALQSNDKARAYDLLGRAIQLAPQNEQAWLWLSGAVDSVAERRYCLEQVLVINPRNAAAQRGLAMLPSVLPVSPFHEEAPPEPITPAPAPVASPAAALGFAALASMPAAQPRSLLDIVAQPDSFVEAHAQSTAPAVVTYMPPPVATAAVAPAANTRDQMLADFVVREFGRHRSRDEVVRALSEQYRLSWGEAQELVARISSEQRRSIAARQSPFLIFLGVVTLIAGCFLVGRGILLLSYLSAEPSVVRAVNPRAMVGVLVQMGVGVMMVLGSTLGMAQTIRKLFK
jgi:hypothetical protein